MTVRQRWPPFTNGKVRAIVAAKRVDSVRARRHTAWPAQISHRRSHNPSGALALAGWRSICLPAGNSLIAVAVLERPGARMAARRALEELCAALQRLPGASCAEDHGDQRRDRGSTASRRSLSTSSRRRAMRQAQPRSMKRSSCSTKKPPMDPCENTHGRDFCARRPLAG